MKYLLISDNHGQWPLVSNIIDNFTSQVDYVIHCGDSEFPPNDPIWARVDAVVKGNMDFYDNYPDYLELDTEDGRILLTHGHLYRINHGTDALAKIARSHNANIVFHGHTHVLGVQSNDGVLLINPGSLKSSRGPYPERTFAIVEISASQINVDYYNHNQEKLPSLSEIIIRE